MIIYESRTLGDNVNVEVTGSVTFIIISSEYEPTSKLYGYLRLTSIYNPSYA